VNAKTCRPLRKLLKGKILQLEKRKLRSFLLKSGAGEESRTLDLNLGKVALYQLSYSRIVQTFVVREAHQQLALTLE
jgi:hypothetical protein